MTNETRTIDHQTIANRTSLIKVYRTLEEDFIPVRELEAMCKSMYNLGTSPLATLRKYFSKNDLDIEIVHTIVRNSTQKLDPKKVRFNKRYPTLIVVNYESNGITRKVEIYYYSACEVKNESKFAGLKFWKF